MNRRGGLVVIPAACFLLASCGASPAASSSPSPSAPRTLTDQRIADAQQLLHESPSSVKGLLDLSAGYLQKVRETGDPAYYPKVDSLLTSALQRDPQSFEATLLEATLKLARHDFVAGLDWGQRAHALRPSNSAPFGAIVDAEVELGRYEAAGKDTQSMVDLRPDLTSYSRVSYYRELHGDVDGAITAMRQAVVAGGAFPENVAYVQVLLGNLYFNRGDLAGAEEQYRQALGAYPGYVHGLAAMGLLRAAQGRYPEALKLYQQAVNVYPLPQYVIGEGDVYSVSGDARMAANTYELAAAEQQLYRANGVDLDQELALFQADHMRDLAGALNASRRAVTNRPSIFSSDGLSWVLYQTGDYHGALAASQQALRLGTRDALFYFHRGMIEARLGTNAIARTDLSTALAINPHFSLLWAGPLQAELHRLGG